MSASVVGEVALANMRRWRADPRAFVRDVLRVTPDEWQDEVLEAASRGRQRICLKASKGPGKSTVLSWLGWWFFTTRLHPKIVATSITEDNLKDCLWAELAKWQQRSPLLKHIATWNAERIVANDHPQTWWMSARNWPKHGDKTQQAETLAGVHADNVMFLVDESGGIPDAVVATAEAGLANVDPAAGREAFLVQAGNPTHTDGPLYRACTRERHLWWVKEISGDPDDPKRAPRVSVKWAREQIEKFGRDSPWVLVNVFGKFPPAQSNTLIGVEDAAAAAKRKISERDFKDEVKILGVDVARHGDDRTVLFSRQGRAAFRPKVFRNLDTMEVAAEVAWLLNKWKPAATFIDVAGFGWGVFDRVRQLGHQIIAVEFGSKAVTGDGKFSNRRSEMWFRMSEWVKAGTGCVPDDPELISELCAPTYKFDASGRLLLEPKDDIKKRIAKSPDLADALALTFAAPVAHPALRELQAYGGGGRAITDFNPYRKGA